MLSLSVIVPAFNEELRLPDTLEKLSLFLDQAQPHFCEVIIVDDGSSDKTAQLVNEKSAADPRFRLLSNPGNRGKGFAVRHGMLEAKGEWCLMSDADLSAPITEFSKLYEAARSKNAAVAIGSRALNRKLVSKHQTWFREFGGRFFNFAMRLLTGLPFADTQCGFKLYRKDAVQAVFSRQALDGFSFDVEDVFIAQNLGFRVLEIPVAWANAEGTRVTTSATLLAFADLLRIRLFQLRGRYR